MESQAPTMYDFGMFGFACIAHVVHLSVVSFLYSSFWFSPLKDGDFQTTVIEGSSKCYWSPFIRNM